MEKLCLLVIVALTGLNECRGNLWLGLTTPPEPLPTTLPPVVQSNYSHPHTSTSPHVLKKTIPVLVAEPNGPICGGIFLTKRHILTDSSCVSWINEDKDYHRLRANLFVHGRGLTDIYYNVLFITYVHRHDRKIALLTLQREVTEDVMVFQLGVVPNVVEHFYKGIRYMTLDGTMSNLKMYVDSYMQIHAGKCAEYMNSNFTYKDICVKNFPTIKPYPFPPTARLSLGEIDRGMPLYVETRPFPTAIGLYAGKNLYKDPGYAVYKSIEPYSYEIYMQLINGQN